MANIKDVAKKAGVSTATVSNVLNGTKKASAEVETKVREAAAKLNYNADPIASGLKGSKTKIIGLVVPSIDSVFFPQVIGGIQKIAEKYGYIINFYCSGFNPALEKKYVTSLMNMRADGIIIDSISDPSEAEYFQNLSELRRGSKNIPVVSIERDLTGYNISSILVDNFAAGAAATQNLIDNGCRKIAHITGPLSVIWSSDRMNSYISALKSSNIGVSSSLIANGDFSLASGYMQAKKLLVNSIEFDGVFASNDLMAIGVLKALSDTPLRTPEQVKIIGFDNIFFTSLTSPPISTINVPKQRMGEEAASHLISKLSLESEETIKLVLPYNLIERKSTNINKNDNWDFFI